ncbi:MAG TPA: DUF456 domain-containing protein [Aeromicrobium sp.]|nr:DUF456 domain-containing protein [Aeromicrobium sp.]
MTLVEVLCAVAILVGLFGIVVPVIPGVLLIAGALVAWAYDVGGGTAWGLAAIGLAVLAVGFVVKYAVPHRRLREAGVPRRTIVVGGILGVVGFFVIPVLGLFVGFVGGIWLAESGRLGAARAWPSTKAALAATGLSILIELASGLVATALFIAGLIAT